MLVLCIHRKQRNLMEGLGLVLTQMLTTMMIVPIAITLAGIVTVASDMHPWKAEAPIGRFVRIVINSSSDDGGCGDIVNGSDYNNDMMMMTMEPIVVTLVGIVIDVRPVHKWKAANPNKGKC